MGKFETTGNPLRRAVRYARAIAEALGTPPTSGFLLTADRASLTPVQAGTLTRATSLLREAAGNAVAGVDEDLTVLTDDERETAARLLRELAAGQTGEARIPLSVLADRRDATPSAAALPEDEAWDLAAALLECPGRTLALGDDDRRFERIGARAGDFLWLAPDTRQPGAPLVLWMAHIFKRRES